jgi:hypothetical protein
MRRILFIIACLAACLPSPLFAASAGDLVKISGNPAVYYLGADGERYVFPTAATYFTWYEDFASVKVISDLEMASFPIGGNVTYRPGTRMVKIQSDPKVYAVSRGGLLRHVGTEAIALCLYGGNWNAQIDDVPDAFFVDYAVGTPITDCVSFDVGAERAATPTIEDDVAPPPPPPVEPATSTPAVATGRRTELTARRSPTTPSGNIARGREVEVLRFILSAAPTGPAWIRKLTFRFKPSDAGFDGADNDAIERWADVNGDPLDDNDVIGLRRYPVSDPEFLGEDATAAIRYGIARGGVVDETPQGIDSLFGDEGHLSIEFATGSEPVLDAGTSSEFGLSLKTDAFALIAGSTVEVRLLGAEDFWWRDRELTWNTTTTPYTGYMATGLPVVSPVLTLP